MSGLCYCETVGKGPDIVFLHGWGMHAGVWEDVVEALMDDYRITLYDLPGHGRSPHTERTWTLEALCHTVLECAPTRAHWIGWSLGGLIAQQVALTVPERVKTLTLVSSTPCFVQKMDWPHAIPSEILHGFAEALRTDYRATLQRFLALEVHGSAQPKAQLQQLKHLLSQYHEPALWALETGLHLLEHVDLRNEWHRLSCPVHLLLGQRDQLVPAAVGQAAQKLLPAAHVQVFPQAAHAPFLSHETAFLSTLREILRA